MKRQLAAASAIAVAALLLLGESVITAQAPARAQALFKAAMDKEVIDGDLKAAIEQYKRIADTYRRSDPATAAQALLRMADAYRRLGDSQWRATLERIIRDFAAQTETAALARTRLGAASPDTVMRADRAVWTGADMFGRVSPDGRFISFTDWAGFSNLALYDLRSNTARPLTGNKGWAQEDPNWGEAQWSAVSPDGQYVAYTWFTAARIPPELRIVSVSGKGVPRTLLKFSDGPPVAVDWSPDGKLLAIAAYKGDAGQIMVASVADGSTQVIASIRVPEAARVFFSPDSRYLAVDFMATRDEDEVGQRDVITLAVDGGGETRAVSNPADDCAVGWSPDGRYLLFSSTRTGARSLWALPVSDGRPQGQPVLLKPDIGSSLSLGVTRTGTLYLYKYVSDRDVKVARIDLNAGRLIGQPVHFSQGLLPDPWFPHWSPDGKYLAYPVRAVENGLAIRSVESGEVRRLLNLRKVQDLQWAPDGNSLIAKAEDSKREGIFQIDVKSGRATFIAPTGGGSFPRWSPDGGRIYYMTRGSIRERDLRTAAEREVFRHPLLQLSNFEVSPDGRHLAVRLGIDRSSQTFSILMVPVTGGEPRVLARVPAAASINAWYQMSWTPDSRALLTGRRSGAAAELWLIETETGRERKLDIDVSAWSMSTGPFSGFALSPAGDSIAFLMGKSEVEVWALENFLSALER
jgi:Tol biopolymer transport system component